VIEGRARLFVALELPAAVRDELVHWREDALAATVGLRPMAPEAMHVTLCFLGSLPATQIEPIGAAVDEAIARRVDPAELSLAGAVWLPKRRPRVIAVELSDPGETLAQIQSVLAGALQAGGWYRPEARPFFAHVTVARVAKHARLEPTVLAAPPAIRFLGSRVTLYCSRLRPAGARYEPLLSTELNRA
jgi:RNA 2',3'-cyclic 3'-phosphodiesterase